MRRAWALLGLIGCADTPSPSLLPVDAAAIPRAMHLYVSPLAAGEDVEIRITGATPGARVRLIRSDGDVGAGGCPALLGGQCLDITPGTTGYVVQLSLVADDMGRIRYVNRLPAALTPGAHFAFQAVDPAADVGSNAVTRDVRRVCVDDAQEDDDDFSTANPLPAGPLAAARICPGDTDWYSIPASAGQAITVQADFPPAEADVDLRLYNVFGILVATANFDATSPEIIQHTAATPGPYLLELYADRVRAAGAAYTVFSALTTPVVCAPDRFEPNDAAVDAVLLGAGSFPNLTTCSVSDYDWFAIDLQVGQTAIIDVLFDHGEGDIDAWLLPSPQPSDTTQLDRHFVTRGVSGTDNERLTWTSGTAQRYWLAVKLYADTGGSRAGNDYHLQIQTN